jgi:hypothetical protein
MRIPTLIARFWGIWVNCLDRMEHVRTVPNFISSSERGHFERKVPFGRSSVYFEVVVRFRKVEYLSIAFLIIHSGRWQMNKRQAESHDSDVWFTWYVFVICISAFYLCLEHFETLERCVLSGQATSAEHLLSALQKDWWRGIWSTEAFQDTRNNWLTYHWMTYRYKSRYMIYIYICMYNYI